MKRWILPLAACLIAAAPMELSAEEHAAMRSPAFSSAPAMVSEMAGQEQLPDVSRELSSRKGFLKDGMIGKDAMYHSFSYVNENGAFGELTVRKKDITGSAILINIDLSGDDAALAETLFNEKGMPMPTLKKVFAFNMGLLTSENIFNQVLLEVMNSVREKTKDPVPYGLISVDYLHVHQFQRNKANPFMYNAMLRAVASVDGWAVPVFIRMTVVQTKSTPKLMVLVSEDSGKNLFNPVMDELAKEISQKEL